MPAIEDLERFKTSFRNLGGEPSTLASLGEQYEDLPMPEQGMDADLASLLETDDTEIASEPVPASEADSFDFGAFLDSIPENPPASPEAAEMEPLADLDALSGESVVEEALPEASPEKGTETTDAFPFDLDLDLETETPTPVEIAPNQTEEDFGLPSDLLAGFADEIEAERAVGDENAPPPEARFGTGLDEFGVTDAATASTAEAEVADAKIVETAGTDDFDLGDFADFGQTPLDADLGAEAVPKGTSDLTEMPSDDFPSMGGLAPEESDLLGDLDEIGGEGASEGLGSADVESLEEIESVEEPEADSEAFSLFDEESPIEPETLPSTDIEDLPAGFDDSDFAIPDFSSGEASPKEVSETDFSDTDLDAGGDAGIDDVFGDMGSGEEDSTPLDSFDTFSLDDNFLASGFGVNDEKATAEKGEEGFGKLEDFSLEGIDDVFGSAKAAPGRPQRRPGAKSAAAPVEEIELSELDLGRLQDTLATYPLNLRLACEELIAEHAVAPDQMAALVKGLVQGTAPKEMASLAGKLIGRTISIPRGFEKRTGEELEAEKRRFSYIFIHTILPVLRTFLLAAAASTLVAYLGFNFVYRPLRANSLYKQGNDRIALGDYARANERFVDALKVWRMKGWFYTYAESFAAARQYLMAEEKYDLLLRNYPRDKKGVLDYAEMESRVLRNYEKADRLIRREILDYKPDDKDGLLALGDNDLAWGEIDPARYEDARSAYARLMGAYGRRDEYLERMLLYFIRTDQLAEVLPLQTHFLSSPKRKIAGASLAELGGYLLDKKTAEPEGVPDLNISKIDNIRSLLREAIRRDPEHPESFYHLARYFETFGSPAEEQSAISYAIEAFAKAPELSARRVAYRVDAHRRSARLYVAGKEFLLAQERLGEGIRLYEDAVRRHLLGVKPEFGRLYADLGDIEYFTSGDLKTAVINYRRAEELGWAPPEIRYRLGYAAYAQDNWSEAAESFFSAASDLSLNRRLLFALGNVFFRRGDLNAAQGYYNRLLDLLETERSRFPVLLPNEKPEHNELAERIMRARNNLGVTLEELAERTGDVRYRSLALALYTESARAWDALSRDPKTMVRSSSSNLAFLNTRGSLYPDRRFEPQIFSEIDKDVLEPSSWEELLASE